VHDGQPDAPRTERAFLFPARDVGDGARDAVGRTALSTAYVEGARDVMKASPELQRPLCVEALPFVLEALGIGSNSCVAANVIVGSAAHAEAAQLSLSSRGAPHPESMQAFLTDAQTADLRAAVVFVPDAGAVPATAHPSRVIDGHYVAIISSGGTIQVVDGIAAVDAASPSRATAAVIACIQRAASLMDLLPPRIEAIALTRVMPAGQAPQPMQSDSWSCLVQAGAALAVVLEAGPEMAAAAGSRPTDALRGLPAMDEGVRNAIAVAAHRGLDEVARQRSAARDKQAAGIKWENILTHLERADVLARITAAVRGAAPSARVENGGDMMRELAAMIALKCVVDPAAPAAVAASGDESPGPTAGTLDGRSYAEAARAAVGADAGTKGDTAPGAGKGQTANPGGKKVRSKAYIERRKRQSRARKERRRAARGGAAGAARAGNGKHPTAGSKPQAAGRKPQASAGGKQPSAASGKQQAASGKRQAANAKQQPSSSGRRQAASGKQQVASRKRHAALSGTVRRQAAATGRQPPASSRWQTVGGKQPAAKAAAAGKQRAAERKRRERQRSVEQRSPRQRQRQHAVQASQNGSDHKLQQLTNLVTDLAQQVAKLTSSLPTTAGDAGGGGAQGTRSRRNSLF
jgi:hypothetical protein